MLLTLAQHKSYGCGIIKHEINKTFFRILTLFIRDWLSSLGVDKRASGPWYVDLSLNHKKAVLGLRTWRFEKITRISMHILLREKK